MIIIKKYKSIFFWGNIFIPIFFGGIIYLSFRKESLLMFTWFNSLGISFIIEYLREFILPFKSVLPEWFLYSLPDGLWLYSFVFFFSYLWRNEETKFLIFWSLIGPVIAIGSEFGQLSKIVPGTFSNLDLFAYSISSLIAFSITQNKRVLL